MTTTHANTPSDWIAASLPNLALAKFGARVGDVSDDFFAPLERLIDPNPPIFVPNKYDKNGKWMDGWESRRRRNLSSDHGDIILGMPSTVHLVHLDTSHFTGNYAPAVALEGLSQQSPSPFTLLPALPLQGNTLHSFDIHSRETVETLRLHLLPDGGVARLRAFGLPVVSEFQPSKDGLTDIAAFINGGKILAYSDAHFGDPWSLIAPLPGADMGDGWETRRRRVPGFDWINIGLGSPGLIKNIVVDTAHFKGNYPHTCSIKAALISPDAPLPFVVANSIYWQDILEPTNLSPDTLHTFDAADLSHTDTPFNALQLSIFPDGGVSRLRVLAEPQPHTTIPSISS